MRFRLLHSRAFWCGVPGLTCLLWAWGISTGHRSYLLAASDVAELLSGQLNRQVIVVRGPGPLPPVKEWVLVHDKLAPGQAEEIIRETREEAEPGIAFAVFIPHALLVSVYCLVRAVLAGWRWRRSIAR